MLDKITIRARVSDDEAARLGRLYCLRMWVNETGDKVEYRSSEYAKVTGVEVRIMRGVATIKTSLHKFWNRRSFGKLRNDNSFTLSEAKQAFAMLLYESGLSPERVRIVSFEIGVSMCVSCDPMRFLDAITHVPRKNDIAVDKCMFVDANYKPTRQKTTEKHEHIRKYFKVYDKGWEMRKKSRRRDVVPSEDEYILRVETVYKRHNESGDSFFGDENLRRLANRFYLDWKDLFFVRGVRAYKGARKSEVECALHIINEGAEEYLASMREAFDKNRLTAKQYRTIREFVRDFDDVRDKFRVIVSREEDEYRRIFPSEVAKNRQ